MTAELDIAVDQMNALFWAAWQASASSVFGYLPAVEWYGRETLGTVDREKVWVRHSTQNVLEGQTTLSTCVDAPFKRRYTSSGLIFVQIFVPKSIDNGADLGRKLAKVARNAYRGKKTDGGVTFHNCRINDLPSEELFYRFNVIAEYDFDELG